MCAMSEVYVRCSLILHLIPLRQALSRSLELWVPPVWFLTALGLQTLVQTQPAFHGCCGFKLQSSQLYFKYFSPLSHFPSLLRSSYKILQKCFRDYNYTFSSPALQCTKRLLSNPCPFSSFFSFFNRWYVSLAGGPLVDELAGRAGHLPLSASPSPAPGLQV